MPDIVWLTCRKNDVQALKSSLSATNQLSRADKVRSWNSDLMIVPCQSSLDINALLIALRQTKIDHSVLQVVEYGQQVSPISSTPQTLPDIITAWHESLPPNLQLSDHKLLLRSSPKRWSTSHPMVLLPSGTFQDTHWTSLLASLPLPIRTNLWTQILQHISLLEGREPLTHLALNSGIPLADTTTPSTENILRSPSGLVTLHGDFGPSLPPTQFPTDEDFNAAFWVCTKQNGIWQTWAPRYTMFSRGNIREKARILAFHDAAILKDSASVRNLHVGDREAVVDLYAGIGYFVFSYAAAGFRRIWCWEINPWSVEGLRRGAIKNKWSVQVFKGNALDNLDLGRDIATGTKIVVFEEGNEKATKRMPWDISQWSEQQKFGTSLETKIKHVNCGFLPSSQPSWRTALDAVLMGGHGWLHLHENVALGDVETRKTEIELLLKSWASNEHHIAVEHVELVKSFAPGVWHCVYDVYIAPTIRQT